MPGFITKGNAAICPFGVMGGFMQPQGHVQVIMNMIDFKLNPQEALDAFRWQWEEDKRVNIEPELPPHIARELEAMGHKITPLLDYGNLGRGQIIIKKDKTLIGGTDKRADTIVAAW